MNPVLIISAVERETALLELALGNSSWCETSVFPARTGTIGQLPVVIAVGGVGKVNAAAATAALIERHQPRLVINTGCGGAYPGSGFSIGDLVVASCEILGDEGVQTSEGWLDLRQMGMPSLMVGQRRFYNEIPLSSHAAEKAMQLADYCGVLLSRGRFVTVSTCSGSLRRGEVLARRFNAVCENMEGAAVALVCQRYGIDCLEIRGISNLVEERNPEEWDIQGAVENAQRLVLKYLEELDRPEPPREQHRAVPEL